MKKLLFLMLVLGTASTAGAALTIRVSPDPCTVAYSDETTYDIDEDDTIYIGVYNDTQGTAGHTEQFTCFLQFDSNATNPPAEFTGNYYIYQPPAVPTAPYVIFYGYYPAYGVDVLYGYMVNGVPTDYTGVGVVFAVEFKCLISWEDVEVTLLRGDYETELDSITIHQVPEPITIALLSLGGLFLRRRK